MTKQIALAIAALCSGCLEDFVIIPPPEPNGLQLIAYEQDGGVTVCPATQIGPRLVTAESRCVRETMSVRTSVSRVVPVVGYTIDAGAALATLQTGEDL